MVLPWGGTTVIGRVVQTLIEAGLAEVVVVTGYRANDVTGALAGRAIRAVYNPDYETGEMLTSVQVGLRALRSGTLAALLCLGDQPQMEVKTVVAVLKAGREDGWRRIVVPTHGRRAGHPILLPHDTWQAVWETTGTLRDVLRAHPEGIRYLEAGTATVLADLDTPRDYDGKS